MIVKKLEIGDQRPWNQITFDGDGNKTYTDKPVLMKRVRWVMIPEDDVEAEYAPKKEFTTKESAYACLGRLQQNRTRLGLPQRSQ